MNMSYCRFRNTKEDLRDCFDFIREADDNDELSRNELDACFWMFSDIIEFLQEFDIIDEIETDVDERLEDFFDELRNKFNRKDVV